MQVRDYPVLYLEGNVYGFTPLFSMSSLFMTLHHNLEECGTISQRATWESFINTILVMMSRDIFYIRENYFYVSYNLIFRFVLSVKNSPIVIINIPTRERKIYFRETGKENRNDPCLLVCNIVARLCKSITSNNQLLLKFCHILIISKKFARDLHWHIVLFHIKGEFCMFS